MLISKLITETSVFALSDEGRIFSVRSDHPKFVEIVAALENDEEAQLKTLIDLQNLQIDGFELKDGRAFIDGQPIGARLESVLLYRIKKNVPIKNLVAFHRRLEQNPSFRVREQLFQFLEKSKSIGITPDGFITAFKLVKKDENGFISIHDEKTRHDIGTTVEMERRLVDDDPNRICSVGLHACSESYLPHYGGGDSWIIVVKIDPADVVCIPTDYSASKLRCCRLEVLQALGEQRSVDEPNLENLEFEDEDW